MYVNSSMAALDELLYAANLSMCGWWTRPETTTTARGMEFDSNPWIDWSLSREQVSSLKYGSDGGLWEPPAGHALIVQEDARK